MTQLVHMILQLLFIYLGSVTCGPLPAGSAMLKDGSIQTTTESDASFEGHVLNGIEFLRENGVGAEFQLQSILADSLRSNGANRLAELNFIFIAMADSRLEEKYITARVVDNPLHAWSGPTLLSQEQLDSSNRRFPRGFGIPAQEAWDLLATAGRKGPWKKIQLIIPDADPWTGARPCEEVVYLFYPIRSSELVVVGALSQRVKVQDTDTQGSQDISGDLEAELLRNMSLTDLPQPS